VKRRELVQNMEEAHFYKDEMTTEEYTGYVEGEQLNSIKKIEINIKIIKNTLIFIFAVGIIGIIIHTLNYLK